MTWSEDDALEQKKEAFRLLLDERSAEFTRSLGWYRQRDSSIPDAIWSPLFEMGIVRGNVVGGPTWRLTVEGWIEACRLLREEIGLDERFGILSARLKDLTEARRDLQTTTTVQEVSARTFLSELWIQDAISAGWLR